MTLAPGMRLGPYEILEPLGAGGMGVVFRARDTRLPREVAIKVLPAQHTADPARRQRFLREAQAVSALNHPNIVTLHDVGESGELSYLVMEHVPGRTLDQHIPRGGLRLGETLHLAMQIADALAKAHAAGILHRDLKPSNVMVTDQGTAKLLDFGLAKLVQQDEARPARTEGTTSALPPVQETAVGTVLGTVAYMSPEQAQGKPLDERSDIFSYGALLYEMATGRRAFQGDSAPAVLAAVIAEEPRPPRELHEDIPRDLERIIQRCLRKDPDRRFHDISDVKVELREVKEESESQPALAVAGGARRRHRLRLALVAAAIAIAAGAAATLWLARRPGPPPPRLIQLSSERGVGEGAFSPDGSQVVYQTFENGLRLRDIETSAVRQLTDTFDRWPAWSADGTQIAFVRFATPVRSDSTQSGAIHVVSPLGGMPRRLVDFPARGPWYGGQISWSPDGRWLAAARGGTPGDTSATSYGVVLIPADGSAPHAVTFPGGPAYDHCPAFSPDGRTLAYASCPTQGGNDCGVHVMPLDAALRPAGASRRLPGRPLRIDGIAWTRDGRDVLYGDGYNPQGGLWRVRTDGRSEPERVELAGRQAIFPSVARSRDRLVFYRESGDSNIYLWEPGRPPTPRIASTYDEASPDYSPDGRRVAYACRSDVDAIWVAAADGSGATRLTQNPGGRPLGSPRWSPDGRTIAFDGIAEDEHIDVWTIGADGAGLRQVTHGPATDMSPSWSRDGRFLYYSSDRTGRAEVWRIPVAGGAEEQITRGGGCAPIESLDGRRLYFMRSGGSTALLEQPTGHGGEARAVVPCVHQRTFAVGPRGIFYVPCGDAPYILHHWDAATGTDRSLGTIDIWGFVSGFTVSPDGRHVLFQRTDFDLDLMLIDNFR